MRQKRVSLPPKAGELASLLTGPHMTVLCESSCIQFIVEKFLLQYCKVCNYCPCMSFSALTNNLIVIVFT